MSAIKLSTPSSGSISLSPADTASNLTITVPANAGTMLTTASTFAGTGPAFSAYQSSAQAISSNTTTKIAFQTEEFDTASAYDAATNYRFTPQIAGYYQISGAFQITSTFCGGTVVIFKNGNEFKRGASYNTGSVGNSWAVSALIYLNGSTDYVELYGSVTVTQNMLNTQSGTYFQGALVRAA